MCRFVSSLLLALLAASPSSAFQIGDFQRTRHSTQSQSPLKASNPDNDGGSLSSRRGALKLGFGVLVGSMVAAPSEAQAKYVLDEATGDYVEIEDVDWQTSWKQRLDKAQGMSTDEIFTAARGAGNTSLKDGPESTASQKRRAMSGCRDVALREKAGAGSEKDCVARVFGGETAFMMDAL